MPLRRKYLYMTHQLSHQELELLWKNFHYALKPLLKTDKQKVEFVSVFYFTNNDNNEKSLHQKKD